MWVGEPPHTQLTATGRAGRYGFFPGVKIPKIRGQILGLGVKPWVVGAKFSRSRAIPHGVRVWVVAVSYLRQGKQSARLSAVHIWRG